MKLRNRLRLWFLTNGKAVFAGAVGNAPNVHGCGASAGLYEAAPLAACGCRSSWQLGEYVDGTRGHVLEFGWWQSTSHSQACRKAEA